MSGRRIARDPSPQGRAAADRAVQERLRDVHEEVEGRRSPGGQAQSVAFTSSSERSDDNRRLLTASDGNNAIQQTTSETNRQEQQDPHAVAQGAVQATNPSRMAVNKSVPDFKEEARPGFSNSDQQQVSSKMENKAKQHPRFEDPVQTTPAVNGPAMQEPTKDPVPVTYKDQCRLHELENVPLPLSEDPAGHQERQQQNLQNALGEDTLLAPSGDGTAPSSQNQPSNGGGGVDTSDLPLQAEAVDSQLESERLRQAIRREWQSQPPVMGELIETRCSRRSTLLIALLISVAVILGTTIGVVLALQDDEPTTSPDTVMSPSTSPPNMPVMSTTAPSVLSTRTVKIVDHINSTKLSSKPIKYPLPPEPTPEEQALHWLIIKDPLHLTVDEDFGRARISQRFALLTFWFSTNGTEWTNKKGWLDEDECGWSGIECNPNSVFSFSFDGRNNNCMGSIPADLALLTSCTLIDLSSNPGLGGTIPSSLKNMVGIKFLNLKGCQLTGAIPDAMGSLSSLTELDLSNNKLSGTLPKSIGNLTNIKTFDVSSNRFRGSLPSTISSWSDLAKFHVCKNEFEGTMPPVAWPKLEEFFPYKNAFTGTLSESIGSFSRLKKFRISRNKFTGTLPPSIGNWTDLLEFYISGDYSDNATWNFENRFSGTLPSSIGAWSQLQIFQIAIDREYLSFVDRSITGSLPTSIANWTSLQYFVVQNHQLKGSLPPEIGAAWSSMIALNVANNSLMGTLPEEIGQWVKVEIFNVRDNQFTGTIPQSIANWTSLIIPPQFHHNNLTGTIPSAICEIPSLRGNLYADCQVFCDCCDEIPGDFPPCNRSTG